MGLSALLVLAVTSFAAATVNGALGYGYSSISVPIALLVTVGRVLNPALVIVEVAINLYALYWNRRTAGRVIRRVIPLAVGLVPGVIAGALLLGRIEPTTMKLVVFGVLLPLILLQASGRRWPIRRERRAAVPLGAGVGVVYGLTTISGPPLALFWNNQGFAKDDFKVALAIVRSIESVCALLAYAYLGLLTSDSAAILPWIVPGVLIGFPLGHVLIQRIGVETFRRICMSFDAYIVAFGLSRTLESVGVPALAAYQVMIAASLLDTALLWAFFRRRQPEPPLRDPTALPGAPPGTGAGARVAAGSV
jgi:uncharacterized membrane protein YfcA